MYWKGVDWINVVKGGNMLPAVLNTVMHLHDYMQGIS